MILKKLLDARVKFAEAKVQKTGKGINNGEEYSYFSLNDIIPVKNKIFKELGIVDIVTYNINEVKLELFDVDNSREKVTFTSPMPNDLYSINGNQMMAIGSCETYQRRYLYITALDISEPDHIDGSIKEEPKKSEQEIKEEKSSDEPKKQTKKRTSKQSKVAKDSDTPAKNSKPSTTVAEKSQKDNSKGNDDKSLNILNVIEDDEETTVETIIPVGNAPTVTTDDNVSNAEDDNVDTTFDKDTDIEFMVQNMSEEYALTFAIKSGKNKGKRMVDLEPRAWEWYYQNFNSDNRYNAVAKVLLLINNLI